MRERKVYYVNKRDCCILGQYKSLKEASALTGVSAGTIGSQVVKMGASRGDKCFIYQKDYNAFLKKHEEKVTYTPVASQEEMEIEYRDEIIKRKEKQYYINILVGLANGTLEDGAIYRISDSDLIYNKECNRLEIAGQPILTQQQMYEEIEVELPILNEEERKFLKNLLKAFGNVKGIRKCKDSKNGFEFIRIEADIPTDNVDLPTFVENKYYKSMQQNRLYSLEELELECYNRIVSI